MTAQQTLREEEENVEEGSVSHSVPLSGAWDAFPFSKEGFHFIPGMFRRGLTKR
jgi:hypothetical protein